MALDKRAEILFSAQELEALRHEAERRGISLGELVRDAVRRRPKPGAGRSSS
jgi:ribbon-helix-helix CopG family protein